MYSEGDTDSVSLRLPNGSPHLAGVRGEGQELVPLDYFSNMVRSISSGSVVAINLGTDYPVRLDFEIADKKGTVRYLLAPRIESD